MLNKLNQEFYVNECILNLRAYQQELIASNIANSDTPNYIPINIDFSKTLDSLLKKSKKNFQNELKLTSKKHIPLKKFNIINDNQKIVNKNYIFTKKPVNAECEKINFIKNSLFYQIEISIINNKFKNLMNILKG
ncbi:MAG: flagellar basal body rod protein FlgB [Buchnera aphidicola (Nurudea yanoniella)]